MARPDRHVVLEGHRSVEAALAAASRDVYRILAVRPGDRRLGRLRALARRRGVAIDVSPPERIEELATGGSHGGVLALVGPRHYETLDELLAASRAPLLVMLDGVEDPFNHGQAIRSLYAAGVDGLVLRDRSWESAAGVVARASGGASERMPTASVSSVAAAGDRCRAAGLQIVVAATAPGATSLGAVDLCLPTLLIVGGERRGVTRSFAATADVVARIRYGREDAPSLGTAAAAAVIAFEALRQRRAG